MAWVRTDGRKIADDPGLLRQGKSDMATCSADLDSGMPTVSAKGCMAVRGYALVWKDQAEELRAAYAAAARKGAVRVALAQPGCLAAPAVRPSGCRRSVPRQRPRPADFRWQARLPFGLP